ncbi:hypothetical protein JB92DRAFT_3006730 [Gautieria morchelliformis]|nr:hypothetical protein JB92DRAFT_3006730 [Gautieria morchelliformis]
MSLKLALPNDVLIRVFKELDAYDLCCCSLLAVAGLEDGSTNCQLSIAERLAQLKTFEQGWASLNFRQKLTVTLPQGYNWKLHGDVLAMSLTSRLLFTQLLSAIRGTPVHTWRKFAIDPAQDLAILFLEASSLGANILSFSFLSLRHFVIVRCISKPEECYQPQLVVYDFITAHPEGSMEPRLVCIYQLPHVAQYTLTRSFTLSSEPSSELPTSSGKSFYHTSCSHLMMVTMHFTVHFTYSMEEPDQEYVLFVHASSLLEEVDAHSNAEQLTVPWESWGPLKTRILPVRMYDVVEDGHWRAHNRLRMLDFNPLALQCALSSNDPPLSASEDESGAFSTTIAKDSQPMMIHEVFYILYFILFYIQFSSFGAEPYVRHVIQSAVLKLSAIYPFLLGLYMHSSG